MISRYTEHALQSRRSSLLTEHHLKNGLVNWLARDLTSKVVKFSMRDFEHSGRVLVLWGVRVPVRIVIFECRRRHA